MEYRAWITIPGLPWTDEAKYEPLIRHLESEHAEYGPTLGWHDPETAHIVMLADTDDRAAAAQVMFDAVAQGLRAVGRGDLHPATVEIEAIEAELAPA